MSMTNSTNKSHTSFAIRPRLENFILSSSIWIRLIRYEKSNKSRDKQNFLFSAGSNYYVICLFWLVLAPQRNKISASFHFLIFTTSFPVTVYFSLSLSLTSHTCSRHSRCSRKVRVFLPPMFPSCVLTARLNSHLQISTKISIFFFH